MNPKNSIYDVGDSGFEYLVRDKNATNRDRFKNIKTKVIANDDYNDMALAA